MEITISKKKNSIIDSEKKKQVELNIPPKKESFLVFDKAENENINFLQKKQFEINKLPNEISSVEDLWKKLALGYIEDPVNLVMTSDIEIYQYKDLAGIYYRCIDYLLNKDTFYKKYENGLLSEKLSERSF